MLESCGIYSNKQTNKVHHLRNMFFQDIELLREKRNKICDLVGVSRPKLLKSGKPKAKASTVEQFDSYSDLVGRAGY